ncbi:response regulator [Thalassoglobus sp.]|uniref:hybrid sensor histidine kinase/response regulator n=1 Tax=Thalassoglobus sp. TaxID=2795869 RepID=UPI003AA97CFD
MSPQNNHSDDLSGSQAVAAVRSRFSQLANAANDVGAIELQTLSASLVDLTSLAETWQEEGGSEEYCQEILAYCNETLPTVEKSLNDYPDSLTAIQETLDSLDARWGEYLDLLADSEKFTADNDDVWQDAGSQSWGDENLLIDEQSVSEDVEAPAVDVSALLSTLETMGGMSLPPEPKPASETAFQDVFVDRPVAAGKPSVINKESIVQETLEDPEMIPAYVDDAQQCLAGMEMCLFELDNDKKNVEPLQKFCRELHTLKGASGTVGLTGLAEYLHNLENQVEAMSTAGEEIQTDPLLEGVDFVRQQLQKLVPNSSEPAPASDYSAPASSGETATDGGGETYVRIEASRLDRLMDLLAELVMLRNRRETYVGSLRHLHHDVSNCAMRLRLVDTYAGPQEIDPHNYHQSVNEEDSVQKQENRNKQLTASISEIAKDVSELGRTLQEVFDPLSQDNSTISHLIGCYRTELMELRRQPIAGLFRRLYRVARDASKAEGKSVELQFQGQGTRAERSLQERLYEPLMHIIRNAVSHGVEGAEDRKKLGKPATGQVTLNSWSDATSLYLEIRDDGRGLDEQKLEQRGRELGLITPGMTPSREQLRELILQPGFSTKTEVSQISGRGVGMDVVASMVRSMRGRITIESVVGEYTAFVLEIPLRSTIEHAMVVRSGEQLFALPMHSVFGTQTDGQVSPDVNVISLCDLMGIPSFPSASQRIISLRQNLNAEGRQNSSAETQGKLTIAVDAVVGVEEVVVRSLPRLLSHHGCFSGVTLSGEAETVLMLDVPRLSDFANQLKNQAESANSSEQNARNSSWKKSANLRGLNANSARILIVDDSLSVRKAMNRKLSKHSFEIVEAADGAEALDILRNGDFDGVVSDIDMPRMNGIEFITALRRVDRFADLPVVVVSGRRDPQTAETIANLGVIRMFAKPVNDTLVKSIAQALRHSKTAASASV